MDGLDVVYSEVSRERDGSGYAKRRPSHDIYIPNYKLTPNRFVEYETEADLKAAVDKIDGREFRGAPITCAVAVRSTPLNISFHY